MAVPLPAQEQVLLDVDGIQVLARPFRVIRSAKGPLPAGSEILVARARYGVSPQTRERLDAQGLVASEAPDSASENPPWDHPLYVLGLNYTGDDYSRRAWTPANGPHSRVAFDAADLRTARAVDEAADVPLHQRLEGIPLRTVLRRLAPR